jgi:ATP-binding cassette, subfamily B, bacterial
MRRYRMLLKYPLSQWIPLSGILVLTMSTSLMTTLQPWPLKILVDYAVGDTEIPAFVERLIWNLSLNPTPITFVFLAAIASLGLFALNGLLDTTLTWSWATAGQRMVYRLTADLYSRFQRLSIMYHRRNSAGDALSRLTEDTYCVYSLTSDLLFQPSKQALTLAMVGTVAWNLNPDLTLISMAIAPIMALSSIVFAPRLKERALLNRQEQSRLMSFVHQTITSIPLVQSFGTERLNQSRFNIIAKNAVSLSKRSAFLESCFNFVNGSITTAGSAVVLFAGGKQVLSGSLSVGSLLVFLAYLRSMQDAVKGLVGIYGNLKVNEARVDRVLEIMLEKDLVRESKETKTFPTIRKDEGRHIRIENVTFGYKTGCPVLKNITFEAFSGEFVAVVGPTGSGKSTLISLIIRFFDPWNGRILIDGIDVRKIKLSILRSEVAAVLQDPFLLPLTVAQNVAYGRPDASPSEIVAASIAANADEFIRNLPNGYDTVIGERGTTLSGGQKQRLAIARALLKKAPILIFDEPTSALDAKTENILLEKLERFMSGRTTFVIAHRLSTIRKADRIIVIEDGEIKETGAHTDLLKRKGLYKKLYDLQLNDTAKRRPTP